MENPWQKFRRLHKGSGLTISQLSALYNQQGGGLGKLPAPKSKGREGFTKEHNIGIKLAKERAEKRREQLTKQEKYLQKPEPRMRKNRKFAPTLASFEE